MAVTEESYEQQKQLNLMILYLGDQMDGECLFQRLYRRIAQCLQWNDSHLVIVSAVDLTEFVYYFRQNQQVLKDLMLITIKMKKSGEEGEREERGEEEGVRKGTIARVLLNLLVMSSETQGQKQIMNELKCLMLSESGLSPRVPPNRVCPLNATPILH